MNAKNKFQNFLQLSVAKNIIEANIAYCDIDSSSEFILIGTFYGYCGGGAFQDGYFLVNQDLEVTYYGAIEDVIPEYQPLLESLVELRVRYESDETDGGLSSFGREVMESSLHAEPSDSCVYYSEEFDVDWLPIISASWGLSVSWDPD